HAADGERLAYVTPPESLQQGKLWVVSQSLAQTDFEMPFNFEQFFSIPQTSDFLVIQNNQNLIVFEETEARAWLSADGFIADIQIRDKGVVFVSLDNSSSTLVSASWDDDSPTEILKISEYPFFDAKWDSF
nr:hypothetical protein [Anaerolineae bacterium]